VQSDRFRPPWERGFDAFAMSAYPHVARGFGYTFRVGDASQLGYDAKRVLHDVWAPLGIDIPDEVAWVGERFMNTATWIVAYHRARPVGVMGLFDPREASPNMMYNRVCVPPNLDLSRTREIARLAILREHRGGAQLVMVGLLREMLRIALEANIRWLLTSSTEALLRVYRRFNPTARIVETVPVEFELPEVTRYFASPRAVTGPQVLFTFEVEGARPWEVFSRFLRHTVGLRSGRRR
jgi:hypothetical protein